MKTFKQYFEEGAQATGVKMKLAQELADKHSVPLAQIVDQLSKGIKTEHEHTNNNDVATKIAYDHIKEIPDYYTKLDKMEKGEC